MGRSTACRTRTTPGRCSSRCDGRLRQWHSQRRGVARSSPPTVRACTIASPLVCLHATHNPSTPRRAVTRVEWCSLVADCSELVCALWQRTGILRPGCRPASFWPGDLVEGGAAERWLSADTFLSPEVVLIHGLAARQKQAASHQAAHVQTARPPPLPSPSLAAGVTVVAATPSVATPSVGTLTPASPSSPPPSQLLRSRTSTRETPDSETGHGRLRADDQPIPGTLLEALI